MTVQCHKFNSTFYHVVDESLKMVVGYVSLSRKKKTWGIYTKEGNIEIGKGEPELSVALDKAVTFFGVPDYCLQELDEELQDYGD